MPCIDEYLGGSAPWRAQGKNQLLLSHMKPFKEVQSSTIANWMKLVLKMAGIDTLLYKAHSCRSASTSRANVLGISLKYILKRGNWSGASTWQRHYNKKIVNTRRSSEFETRINLACCRYILQSRHGHCKCTHFFIFIFFKYLKIVII